MASIKGVGRARGTGLWVAALCCAFACGQSRDEGTEHRLRTANGRPRNVLFILIDTLRADHLGCYGYERATSEHIDALASRGALFEHTSSVASYTKAAIGSLFTGLFPSRHGAVAMEDPLSGVPPTLAEVLSEAGIRTVGHHLNANIGAVFRFDRGFDAYGSPAEEYRRKLVESPDPDQPAWLRDDRAITEKALEFFADAGDEPFFLYLHFIGPHAPYTPPRSQRAFLDQPLTPTAERHYEQRDPDVAVPFVVQVQEGLVPVDEQTRKQFVDLYDGEIVHTDAQVGAVLQALQDSGLADDTVVVLTSDHGEELWDHGGMTHGRTHYLEQLHVPLIIAGPGIAPRRVATPVSFIDLMPTVLALAGVEAPPGLQGRSLLEFLESDGAGPGRDVYAEGLVRLGAAGDPIGFLRSLRRGDHKLVVDARMRRKYLFDLSEDPGEDVNRVDADPDLVRDLLSGLVARHDDNLDDLPDETGLVTLEGDVEDELRALGYVGSEADAENAVSAMNLFRTPWRVADAGGFGFLGDERALERYSSRIEFARPESYDEEQLLYGWRFRSQFVAMQTEAGARLARGAEHTRWRLKGSVPETHVGAPPLTLAVRIDGGEPKLHVIEGTGSFELVAPLPAEGARFVRFDFACSGGKVPPRGPGDLHARRFIVGALELLE